MQSVTPFLWFDDQAEAAATFYTSLFSDGRIVDVQRRGADGPAFSVTFQLHGGTFMALNGGPHYRLSPAFSMFVQCDSQAEVDALWGPLCEGGQALQCGWVTDRFGLTWQIIPALLPRLLSDPDPAKAQRVQAAMMKMVKIDSDALQRAYDQA